MASQDKELLGKEVSGRSEAHITVFMMLLLTFSTGVIDAVGYLGLDRVFTGNMTGNVVILGMALLGGNDLPVVGPIIALAAFFLGAMTGGIVLRRVTDGWSHRTTILFGLVSILLGAAAVLVFTGNNVLGSPLQLSVTAILGVAMGVQAATARHLAVKDVTTVVVTSTLTGLGADLFRGREQNKFWRRRLAAVTLIGTGAAAGAALLLAHIGFGIGLSAVLSAIVAVIGFVIVKKR